MSNPWQNGMLHKIMVWMTNLWLGWDVQSVTVGCHRLAVQTKSGLGWFFETIQVVSFVGRPIHDRMGWLLKSSNPIHDLDGIGDPNHDLDGMILKSVKSHHGWDIQSVTPYCHRLDVPSKSWIGHPNRDLDDFIKHPIMDWTSNLWHCLDDSSRTEFGWPFRDRPGWLSKPWHTFVTDGTVSKPWRSGQTYIYGL
jgi:hypothetical protein